MSLTATRLRGLKRGVAFTPASIPGLVGWYKADDLTGVLNDADPVSTWTDQSGAGRNLTQAGGSRPIYKASILNGHAVIRFDGSDDRLHYTAVAAPDVKGYCIVAKDLTGGDANGDVISLEPGQPFEMLGYSTSTGHWAVYGTQTFGVADTGIASTTQAVLTVVYTDATHADVYVNGPNTNSFDPPAYFSGTITYLTVGGNDNGGTSNMKCEVAELCTFNQVLGAGDRASLHSYMGTKYGITIT